jgi:hypothetical protein
MYGGAKRIYNHAMNSANGAKLGTTNSITPNDATKFKIPERQFLAEFWRASSMVLMSVVKRFKIRPMGVTSKNLAGARVIRRRRAMKRAREACKLE